MLDWSAIPALATSTSMRPSSRCTCPAACCTAAKSRTSAATAWAATPASLSSSMARDSSGPGSESSTTVAPDRPVVAATARPMPVAPPVISTTVPGPVMRTPRLRR